MGTLGARRRAHHPIRLPLRERVGLLRAAFDTGTGPTTSPSGEGRRGREENKTSYRGQYAVCRDVHGITRLHRDAAAREDRGRPYVVLDIEGTEYNGDVSEKIP